MKHTVHIGSKSYQLDFGFILILILMGLTSCFAIYNSFNLVKDGSGLSTLIKQAFWYLIGFVCMFAVAGMNKKVLYKYIGKAYWFLMALLLYLFASRMLYLLTGYALPFAPWINGAFSWLRFGSIGFQPSEFIKIVLIVQVSVLLNQYFRKYSNPTAKDDLHVLWQIAKVAVLPLVLIFIQPDTGVCIIIAFTLMVLILCSGVRRQYIWFILGLGVFAVSLFFYLYYFHQDILMLFISGYRLQRIEAWLNPDAYILGSSNQLYTALLSLGSAGLTGYGLQANIVAIPEAHTDFIFAAFGQCFGLVGTVFILLVCLLLDLYLCRMAFHMRSRTDRYITIGVIAMLLYQQIQNLGMIVGLVPITGVTLPLISYGGSSIVSYFLAFGLVLRASPKAKKEFRLSLPGMPQKEKAEKSS